MSTETATPAGRVRELKPRRWGTVDLGLLVLRLGFGVLFIMHGWPKISGGPTFWAGVGMGVRTLGVPVVNVAKAESAAATQPEAPRSEMKWGFLSDSRVWGFAAAFAEFVGGIMLILGLFVRPFAFLMLFTMCVAFWVHYSGGDDFGKWSHPAKAAVAFLALLIAGGGTYALGQAIPPFRRKWFA